MQPKPGRYRCTWCDASYLTQALNTKGGRAQLKQRLRSMPGPSRAAALQRVPRAYLEHFSEFPMAVVDAYWQELAVKSWKLIRLHMDV
eukprot:5016230-Karenia_brevis.AAC.1